MKLIDFLNTCTSKPSILKKQIFEALAKLYCIDKETLKIIIEDQISNIDKVPNQRWYNSSAMLIYLKSYLYSPKLYRMYRDNNILIMPHERNIRKLLSGFDAESTLCQNNYKYMKYKIDLLSSREKKFVLMIDEIHIRQLINSDIDYGTFGFDIDSDQVAKTVFAFMVKSIFGPYKEIVHLIPKASKSSDFLYERTRDVLSLTNDACANVISIITDNNSVNIKCFEYLGCPKGISNTINPVTEEPLYLLYDAVHIIKNVRNNWLNKRLIEKPLTFYLEKNGAITKHIAKFVHLFKLYEASEHSVLKVSSKLTMKSLAPSSMEKQNVSLALKIFNMENVNGLRYLANIENKPEYLDTALYLE